MIRKKQKKHNLYHKMHTFYQVGGGGVSAFYPFPPFLITPKIFNDLTFVGFGPNNKKLQI